MLGDYSSGYPAVPQLPLSGRSGAVAEPGVCFAVLGSVPEIALGTMSGVLTRPTPSPFMHGQCSYWKAILLTSGSVL